MASGVIQNNWCEQDWCRYAWCAPTGYNALGAQVKLVTPGALALGCQVRLVSYNITQIRILYELRSDGATANNYTASSNASVDKNVINLKSDRIEKYWQSTGATSEWVQFDAGVGRVISLDTFALIGHNLTSSAVVRIKGYGASGDSAPGSWAAVPVYATVLMPDDPNEDNLIWIAPDQPENSYRHWRVEIMDPTNPDGVLRVGRLVAGSALIFNGENCLDEIDIQFVNYKDEQKLAGFARVSNNRALKKRVLIRFKDLNRIAETNYRLLRQYMQYCRDTLKALVIIDPKSEATKYQFSIYAKLADLPREQHRFVSGEDSYAALELEYDEGR